LDEYALCLGAEVFVLSSVKGYVRAREDLAGKCPDRGTEMYRIGTEN
jgi:hypothetical protein